MAARCKAPQVRRVDRRSKSKLVHIIQIRHRDEVEAPITDWLQEAYEYLRTVGRRLPGGAVGAGQAPRVLSGNAAQPHIEKEEPLAA